jgi:hypothetical protein
MGGFAGVDPYRVRQLADRLKDLADALDRDGATIRKLFSDWDGQINQSLLTQQASQVRNDARDMSRRADEALNLLRQPRFTDPNNPHANWISIPWDVSEINTAQEARQEAADLKKAMDDPNGPQSRATIAQISQSLADHLDDPAYLQAFMNAGGMDDAARAARILHGQDGTKGAAVLSKESEEILARFGQGVQAATTLAQQGKIQLPPDYLKKLTQPADGDMWSVGMLFKYGPPGDKWDSTVLSAVGGAMLDWRSANQMRPNYSAPGVSGTGYIPGGYVEDKNAWYKSLGLSVDYISVGSGDAAQRIQGIDANDPSLILMQRVSENADASRKILTGPDGPKHAQVLVSDKWHTPGPQSFDDAKWPAAVITAATTDRKNHGKESAEAAINIINAGAAEYNKEKGKNDYEKSQYPVPAGITHALSQVFATYVPDFAASSGLPNDQQARLAGDDTEPPMILVGRKTTEDFLSQIMQNRDDAGNVVNAVNAQMSLTAARGMDSPDAQTYLQNLAELRGEVSAAGKHVNLDAAALIDAANKNKVMWLNAIGGGLSSVPDLPTGVGWIQVAISAGLPIVTEQYSTDNAANVESNSKAQFFDDSTSMRVAVVQGLALSGKIQPPANHPEWANGNIELKTVDDKTDFDRWWLQVAREQGGKLDNFDDNMRDSFNRGATQ